jgi:hypothetical protein
VTSSSDKFVATDAALTELDDGLAYDASDDTLYISADGSTTIYHYSTAGSLLGSSPWAGEDCYNSGLALGGQLLYQGADGCNHVYVVDKANPSGPVVFEFDTAVAGDPNSAMRIWSAIRPPSRSTSCGPRRRTRPTARRPSRSRRAPALKVEVAAGPAA